MSNTTASINPSRSTTAPAQPDYQAIKTRQQQIWNAGDYAVLGVTLQIVGEALCEAIDLRSGERVLDVAAGNGNATLAAARRFARVTSTDYVAGLLDKSRRRAAAEQLKIDYRVADAEDLPFGDGSFDVVLSTFGVMFTPDQEQAARELLRVTRAGGRIGLANWTPSGFIGSIFKTVGKHVPPPAGLKPPGLWGTEPRIVELFGPQAVDIRIESRQFTFRYLSAEHWLEVFSAFYGPVLKALESLDEAGKSALRADLREVLVQSNRGGPDSLVIPAEYLEVVITKA